MDNISMEFVTFQPVMEMEWDDFILNQSVNGTFLQTRRFLNYHPSHRFEDVSILIYNDNILIAVCPACKLVMEGSTCFYSHKGSTFGGLITDRRHYDAHNLIHMIEKLEEYLKREGYDELYLRPTASLYSEESPDLMEYCLYYHDYQEYKELNTYVDFANYQEEIIKNLESGKRYNVKKCMKEGTVYRELYSEAEIMEFYEILCETLEKHNVKPVHTVNELLDFKNSRLRDEVGFFGVFLDGHLIAGSMMFYFNKVMTAHTQYLAARRAYDSLSPMSFLYYSTLEEMKKRGFQKVSWGIATENLGKYLNYGLIKNKEAFGSRYSLNKIYYKKIR